MASILQQLGSLPWFSAFVEPGSSAKESDTTLARIVSIQFETLTDRALVVRIPRGFVLEHGMLRVELEPHGARWLPAERLSPTRARIAVQVRRHNRFDEALVLRSRVGDSVRISV